MRSFCDGKNREWKININLFTASKVNRETGIDLTNLTDSPDSFGTRLSENLLVILDVLISLIDKQLDEAKITVEDFASSIEEQHCEAAAKAIIQSQLDFLADYKSIPLQKLFDEKDRQAGEAKVKAVEELEKIVEEEKQKSGSDMVMSENDTSLSGNAEE